MCSWTNPMWHRYVARHKVWKSEAYKRKANDRRLYGIYYLDWRSPKEGKNQRRPAPVEITHYIEPTLTHTVVSTHAWSWRRRWTWRLIFPLNQLFPVPSDKLWNNSDQKLTCEVFCKYVLPDSETNRFHYLKDSHVSAFKVQFFQPASNVKSIEGSHLQSKACIRCKRVALSILVRSIIEGVFFLGA